MPKLDDFAIGDAVFLNGGSVVMSVRRQIYSEDSECLIQCMWIDSAGALQSAEFHPAQLVIMKKAVDAK